MLKVDRLTKRYGNLTAAREVTFSLQPGDVFGFIGSNGAGKTTTIRMIATLLEPTSGTASLNGADIMRSPMDVRRMIGYMPDFFGLYDDVKVWEYLDFFATLYSVPVNQRKGVIDNVLELTDLTVKRDAFVQTLSRGMQQRLGLARCLVHDPALLLLDEPASGLDPRARAELKELIAELGRMGKIVIVSSHILPELADFCNTVGIIERGQMLAFGPVKEIVKGFQSTRAIEFRMLGNTAEAVALVSDLPHVQNARVSGEEAVQLDFSGDHDQQAELLAILLQRGHRVFDFREHHVDLEDVFLKVTTGAVQ
ncbi:MAG TPA: ABC transporter ATP-binding protein [Fimbriimonadaceae bacterium]|nr:ABC transporter ATP-binding protein [Fimbriimonadaceae bacterium]